MTELPMPEASEWAPPLARFYHYVWDTKGIPPLQEFANFAIVTPTFDNLHVYGRAVGSAYPEDARVERDLNRRGRFLGEWFSLACPQGELGTWAWSDCKEITAEQFSAAYQRGWKEEA